MPGRLFSMQDVCFKGKLLVYRKVLNIGRNFQSYCAR